MSTRPYRIHITSSRDSDGRLRYVVAPTVTAKEREAERSYARLAMYQLCGIPNDPLSPPLPLAAPRSGSACDCVSCPPPARVKIESNGGLQVRSMAPLVRDPKRQASSLCTQWVPPHYHKFFCAHDRFRGLPCKQCDRSKREAEEWLAAM